MRNASQLDQLLTPAESRAVRTFVDEARKMLGDELREVRLFGSRARGQGHEESDVDLALITSERGRELRYKIYDRAYDVGLENGVLLAPLVMSERRYEGLQQRQRRIAEEIEAEGIQL